MHIEPTNLILPLSLIFFFGYRFFRFRQIKKRIPEFLNQGALIVDVRTEAEFSSASNPSSINIPLAKIDAESGSLPKNKPIIVCCASGTRSGIAARILLAKGLGPVLNAGPWANTLPN